MGNSLTSTDQKSGTNTRTTYWFTGGHLVMVRHDVRLPLLWPLTHTPASADTALSTLPRSHHTRGQSSTPPRPISRLNPGPRLHHHARWHPLRTPNPTRTRYQHLTTPHLTFPHPRPTSPTSPTSPRAPPAPSPSFLLRYVCDGDVSLQSPVGGAGLHTLRERVVFRRGRFPLLKLSNDLVQHCTTYFLNCSTRFPLLT